MQTSEGFTNQRCSHVMIRLLAGAFFIRAMVAWFGYSDLSLDTDAYARLAVNLSNSGTFGFESPDGSVVPTAFRPPLYPWLLSWFVFDGKLSYPCVAALHLVFGVITVGLTYDVGRRLNLHYAWLAGFAVAVDPLLLRHAQLIMTETVATFLGVLVWWLALIVWPHRASNTCRNMPHCGYQWIALFTFGLVLGLSILARPTAAPWALLCIAIIPFVASSCWKRRIHDCVITSIVVLACITPWTLRNLSHFGKPIWATTHGGYTLLLANNPSLYDHFSKKGPSRGWDAQNFHWAWNSRFVEGNAELMNSREYWMQSRMESTASLQSPSTLDEVTDDQLAYRAALATIAQQPEMFFLSCLYRTTWLWALWPYVGTIGFSTIAIGGWYAGLFSLALIGLWRILRTGDYRGWLVGFALLISLTAVHAVYWSNMRMRSPTLPCVMLLAAAALQALPRRINTSPITISTPPTS